MSQIRQSKTRQFQLELLEFRRMLADDHGDILDPTSVSVPGEIAGTIDRRKDFDVFEIRYPDAFRIERRLPIEENPDLTIRTINSGVEDSGLYATPLLRVVLTTLENTPIDYVFDVIPFEDEAGPSRESATASPTGESIDAVFSTTDDVDVWKFDVEPGLHYRWSVPTSIASARLLSSSGDVLVESADESTGDILWYSGDDRTKKSVYLEATSPTGTISRYQIESFQPFRQRLNGTPDFATEISLGGPAWEAPKVRLSGELDVGQFDWYRFQAFADRTYTVKSAPPFIGAEHVSHEATFHFGQDLSTNRSSSWTSAVDQPAYLRIEGRQDGPAQYSIDVFGDEHGNTFESATRIDVGVNRTTVVPAGAGDALRFRAEVGVSYDVTGFEAISWEVHNENGRIAAINGDGRFVAERSEDVAIVAWRTNGRISITPHRDVYSDAYDTATEIEFGRVYRGSVGSVLDRDLFSLNAKPGEVYHFDVRHGKLDPHGSILPHPRNTWNLHPAATSPRQIPVQFKHESAAANAYFEFVVRPVNCDRETNPSIRRVVVGEEFVNQTMLPCEPYAYEFQAIEGVTYALLGPTWDGSSTTRPTKNSGGSGVWLVDTSWTPTSTELVRVTIPIDGTFQIVELPNAHPTTSDSAKLLSFGDAYDFQSRPEISANWFEIPKLDGARFALSLDAGSTAPHVELFGNDGFIQTLVTNREYRQSRPVHLAKWADIPMEEQTFLRVWTDSEQNATLVVTIEDEPPIDHDNTPDSATAYAPDTTISVNIETVNDVDWYSFDADAEITYYLQADVGADGTVEILDGELNAVGRAYRSDEDTRAYFRIGGGVLRGSYSVDLITSRESDEPVAIALDDVVLGRLDYPGDRDTHLIGLTAGTVVEIDQTGEIELIRFARGLNTRAETVNLEGTNLWRVQETDDYRFNIRSRSQSVGDYEFTIEQFADHDLGKSFEDPRNIRVGQPVVGFVGEEFGDDWLKFPIDRETSYRVEFQNDDWLKFEVYDADQKQLFVYRHTNRDPREEWNVVRPLQYSALPAFLWMRVTSVHAMHRYDLKVTAISSDQHGDTPEDATPIESGTTYSGNLRFHFRGTDDREKDYFSFEAEEGDQFELSVHVDRTVSRSGIVWFELTSETGRLLSNGSSRRPRAWTMKESGKYFIVVRSPSQGEQVDGYELLLTKFTNVHGGLTAATATPIAPGVSFVGRSGGESWFELPTTKNTRYSINWADSIQILSPDLVPQPAFEVEGTRRLHEEEDRKLVFRSELDHVLVKVTDNSAMLEFAAETDQFGDFLTQAKRVALPFSATDTISREDRDFIEFSARKGQIFNIDASVDFVVWNSYGVIHTSNGKFAATEGGDYVVEPRSDSLPRGYTISINEITDSVSDHRSDAVPVLDGVTTGELEYDLDVDWHSFDASRGRLLSFDLQTSIPVDYDHPFRHAIQIYDSEGNYLSDLRTQTAVWRAPNDGPFFAKIVGPAALYEMRIDDSDRHSEFFDSATPLAPLTDVVSTIDVAGDFDVYRIDVQPGINYRISLPALHRLEISDEQGLPVPFEYANVQHGDYRLVVDTAQSLFVSVSNLSRFALSEYSLRFDVLAGDSNLDGVFDSADLIQVFQRNEYEDDVVGNSTFADGDWNGDGEFDSADLVLAFQQGSYSAAAVSFLADVAANDIELRQRLNRTAGNSRR